MDGLYQEAEKISGIPHRTLETLKQISERFEITRRLVNLDKATISRTITSILKNCIDAKNEDFQPFLYNIWRKMSLWIARENLADHGGDRRSENFNDANAPLETWSQYCEDIVFAEVKNKWVK